MLFADRSLKGAQITSRSRALPSFLTVFLVALFLALAASPALAAPPTASFSYTINGPVVNFTDTSSDPDNDITVRSWDWGDGSPVENNPDDIFHRYTGSGPFVVTLTVTDSENNTDSKQETIVLSAPPPDANFEYSVNDKEVTFTNQSTSINGIIVSSNWDFGDGSSSMLDDPVHLYSVAGTYAVTLTVTNQDGATDSITQNVTVVSPAPIYNFQGFASPVANPDSKPGKTTWNLALAGKSIPVKFSLGGNQGLDIFAAGSPSSTPVACPTKPSTTVLNLVLQYAANNSSGLTYKPSADQYTYAWKTNNSFKGLISCQRLDVQLKDGTTHSANFILLKNLLQYEF